MNNKILFKILGFLCFLFFSSALAAQSTATWALTADGNGSFSGTNIFSTISPVAFGTGISSIAYTANGVETKGWNSTTLDNNDYYEYAFTVNTNTTINVVNLTMYNDNIQTTMSAAVYYSLDGFATRTQIGSNIALTNQVAYNFTSTNLNISRLNNETLRVRVYAWNAHNPAKQFYNKDVQIGTGNKPTVNSPSSGSITSNSAVLGGTIAATGGANVIERGIYYSTIDGFADGAGTKVSVTPGPYVTGAYTLPVSGLSPGTIYYYKAFATNSVGSGYSAQETFTTLATIPTVTTTIVSNIASTTATSGGNVTDNGGSGVTARGVCWNTTGTPTTSDPKTIDGSGTGSFTSNLTGLLSNQTYYVRAYATNTVATGYGSELSFMTGPPKVTGLNYSALCHNGFTAHWASAAGAISYRLNVYTWPEGVDVPGFTDLVVGNVLIYRVEGLSASTGYRFRVRAYNGTSFGDYSDPTDVSTTAAFAGQTANTTIGGAATIFDVPPLTGFTDNDVVIDPIGTDAADMTVVVEWHPAGYDNQINLRLIVKINCNNNAMLNGTYRVHYDGLGFTPGLVAYKWSGSWSIPAVYTIEANYADITISGLAKGSKDELIIGINNQESTLPVELSSFTAVLTVQNFVRLMWVTQSETNLSGYCIFRNFTYDLNTAVRLNAFIPATNTSSEQVYAFEDTEAYPGNTWYYWLQSVELDGSSNFHGPLSITVNNDTPGQPPIAVTNGFRSVYPNPFNPDVNIEVGLKQSGKLQVFIYNQKGQLVKTIADRSANAGIHTFRWNGKNSAGAECSSGTYLIRMVAGGSKYEKKVVLLK